MDEVAPIPSQCRPHLRRESPLSRHENNLLRRKSLFRKAPRTLSLPNHIEYMNSPAALLAGTAAGYIAAVTESRRVIVSGPFRGAKGDGMTAPSSLSLADWRPIGARVPGSVGTVSTVLLPLHGGDNRLSLRVNAETGRFRCFKCHSWGFLVGAAGMASTAPWAADRRLIAGSVWGKVPPHSRRRRRVGSPTAAS